VGLQVQGNEIDDECPDLEANFGEDSRRSAAKTIYMEIDLAVEVG
jgi:hypothetical protein